MNNELSSPYGICCSGPVIDSSICFDYRKQTQHKLRGILPHWHQDGVLQFVTLRLADSLPQQKLLELQDIRTQWMAKHPLPWDESTRKSFEDVIGERYQSFLDANYGKCVLKQRECWQIVVEALRFFDAKRYYLYDYVVMPNHVHFVAYVHSDSILDVIRQIKRYSARKINAILGLNGRLWQRECFDRMVRSAEDYERISDYIRQNFNTLRRL